MSIRSNFRAVMTAAAAIIVSVFTIGATTAPVAAATSSPMEPSVVSNAFGVSLAQGQAQTQNGDTPSNGKGGQKPEFGPSKNGKVKLSAQGRKATEDLAAILNGDLPEPTVIKEDGRAKPKLAKAKGRSNGVALAGPTDWEPGQPIEIALQVGDVDVMAVEAAVTFDDQRLEFGGADKATAGTQIFLVDRGSTIATGAVSCSARACGSDADQAAPIDEIRLRFVPDGDDGAHRFSFENIRLVRSNGAVLSPADLSLTVGETDGPATQAAASSWSLNTKTKKVKPVPPGQLDHTLDGRIDAADITEAFLAWKEVRSLNDPCNNSGPERLNRHDMNDDGCIDVADLRILVDTADRTNNWGKRVSPTPRANGRSQGSGGLQATGFEPSGLGRAAPVDVAVAISSAAQLNDTLDFDPYSWPTRVGTATHVVNSIGDDSDGQVNDGVCATGAGVCTLRAAINQSNADPGPNRIEFNIPGNGPHLIQLTDRLPIISDMSGGVTIDGYTQSGASPNTHPLEFQGDIRIEIAGNGYTIGYFPAFTITSPENVIRGLAIHTVTYGVHLDEDFAKRNHIVGNIIGTDVDATINHPVYWKSEGSGVFLNAGPKFNVIGTPDPADRNLLSGNASWGVRMDQGGTDGNIMWNNLVGMSPDGQTSLANNGGVDVQWRASFNIIGGLNEGERNLFSGSDYTGVDFSHQATDNYALGNLMGTTLDGTSYTTETENRFGVIIKDDAHHNVVIGNVLSNNREHGLWNKHNYTKGNVVIDNYVGLTIDGNPAPNVGWGMVIRGLDDIIENNYITNSAEGGIYLDSTNGTGPNGNETSVSNRLSQNIFYGNGGLGIDIVPVGTNSNDPGDGDFGTNTLLNHPVFSSVGSGQVSGNACAGCEVEIYLADESSNNTQGQQYLTTVVTDGSGNFSYSNSAFESGRRVTALAIDAANNTSEFTPYIKIGGPGNNPDLPTGGNLPDPGVVPMPDPTPPTDGGRLETTTSSVAGSWTGVTFAGSFADPVAACTVRMANNTSPVVVRMQNLTSTGMEIRLQNPGDLVTPVADTVDCLIADAGAWTLPDGTKMEAGHVDVAGPNHVGSWDATRVTLSETFGFPLVTLGQVMTSNDAGWSTFWSRGNAPQNAPTPTNLRVGYHVGEDPDQTRAGERVGYIVFDVSHGTLGGVEYESGRTSDSIKGPTPVNHNFATAFGSTPSVIIASQSAMDGTNGSWVVQSGGVSASGVNLRIDEDQTADAERNTTTEMVGYLALAGPLQLAWGADPGFQPGLVAWDDFERTTEEYWGTAVFGGAWETLFGPTARDQFASDGRGQVIVTPGIGYEAVLNAVHQRDIDSSLVATVDTDPDANFDVNLHQRWIDSSTFYRGRVRIQADNRVRVQIVRADGGSFSSLAATTLALTFTPGEDLAIRMATVGDGTTSNVRLKVWHADQPEPIGWSIEVADSSASLQGPGAFGLRFQMQSSSNQSSATFSVDNILAVSTR